MCALYFLGSMALASATSVTKCATNRARQIHVTAPFAFEIPLEGHLLGKQLAREGFRALCASRVRACV